VKWDDERDLNYWEKLEVFGIRYLKGSTKGIAKIL